MMRFPGGLTQVEKEFAARGIAVQAEVSSLGDPSIVATFSERGYRLVGFENVLGLDLPEGLRNVPPTDEVTVSRTSEGACMGAHGVAGWQLVD